MSIPALCETNGMFLCGCGVEAQGGITEWRNQCPEGVVFGESVSAASGVRFILYISFKPVTSHSLLLTGSCTFSMVKYIKCAPTQQPQVHSECCNVFKLLSRNIRNVICVNGFSTETSVSLEGFSLYFERSRQKQCSISTC